MEVQPEMDSGTSLSYPDKIVQSKKQKKSFGFVLHPSKIIPLGED